MKYNGLISLEKALYRVFCKQYGKLLSMDVVIDFLAQVDDLREVNEKYADYLYDYAEEKNLIGC